MLKRADGEPQQTARDRKRSGFDTEDLRDWSKEAPWREPERNHTWLSTPPLPAYIIGYIESIRESITGKGK
ncbi:MAG: hypothetical protein R2912_10095 [Eubacteriales bacterium]